MTAAFISIKNKKKTPESFERANHMLAADSLGVGHENQNLSQKFYSDMILWHNLKNRSNKNE